MSTLVAIFKSKLGEQIFIYNTSKQMSRVLSTHITFVRHNIDAAAISYLSNKNVMIEVDKQHRPSS